MGEHQGVGGCSLGGKLQSHYEVMVPHAISSACSLSPFPPPITHFSWTFQPLQKPQAATRRGPWSRYAS